MVGPKCYQSILEKEKRGILDTPIREDNVKMVTEMRAMSPEVQEWRGVLAVMRRYEKQDEDSPPGLLGDHGSVDTWILDSELSVSCETVDYMWPKVKYIFFFSS